jgi:hypothetical protein
MIMNRLAVRNVHIPERKPTLFAKESPISSQSWTAPREQTDRRRPVRISLAADQPFLDCSAFAVGGWLGIAAAMRKRAREAR